MLIGNSFPVFIDLDGTPLHDGSVYFGAVGANPETNPTTVYWDSALSQPAAQPVKTQNGYFINNGVISNIYAAANYSIAVHNKAGALIYRMLDSSKFDPNFWFNGQAGSGSVGFSHAATYQQGTLGLALNNVLNVKNAPYNAILDNTADDAAAIQAALDACHNAGGGTVFIPAGTAKCNSGLRVYANTTLCGQGWGVSKLNFTHTGDGILSSWPINSSSSANINVIGLSITNGNAGNTGGGFVDVGGTYVNVENCLISGFKYGVIFDQTELAVIKRNNFIGMTAQVWLVNGPDHTPSASKGYTNRITITDNQFNGSGSTVLIVDDGGANHYIANNNFNVGATQIRAAGTAGLSIINNEFEGTTSYNIYFAETTLYGGVRVGGPVTFSVNANTMATGGGANLFIDEAYCGEIVSNYFYLATSSALQYDYGPNYRIGNIAVSGNIVGNSGAARTATPLVLANQLTVWKRQGNWKQGVQTYCTSGFGTGNQQITPASMVGIYDGAILRIVNADGTNPETVTAYIALGAPTTFFATLTSSKSVGFLIFVEDGDYSDVYTPNVTGSAPTGGSTITSSYGSFTKTGNRCSFQSNATWSALTGGAAGQMQIALPLRVKTDSSATTMIPIAISGAGVIGKPALFAVPASGSISATIVYIDSTTGTLTAFQVPSSGTYYISGSYEI